MNLAERTFPVERLIPSGSYRPHESIFIIHARSTCVLYQRMRSKKRGWWRSGGGDKMDIESILIGSSTTLLGFVCFAVYDHYKYGKILLDNERKTIFFIKGELEKNLITVNYNISRIDSEIAALERNSTILDPLTVFDNSMWNMAAINFPQRLLKSETVNMIRLFSGAIDLINETIRSRENYRMQNQNMSDFLVKLKLYDQMLKIRLPELENGLKILLKELEDP